MIDENNLHKYIIKESIELGNSLNTTSNEDFVYEYFNFIFKNFAKEKDESDNVDNLYYQIKGRMGSYDGDGFDVFFSPSYIK